MGVLLEAEAKVGARQRSLDVALDGYSGPVTPLSVCAACARRAILAFFDHPISNGYTEALNGVAKVINRSGRGYSFDVLRARLLFKNKVPSAAFTATTTMNRTVAWQESHTVLMDVLGNRCGSCSGVFDGLMLEAHHIRPIVAGERVKTAYLCPSCHRRFHTEGVSQHDSVSTQ